MQKFCFHGKLKEIVLICSVRYIYIAALKQHKYFYSKADAHSYTMIT